MTKKPLEMAVYMDSVDVEGQVIKRPDHVHRSWWMGFWEGLDKLQRCPRCGYKSFIGG